MVCLLSSPSPLAIPGAHPRVLDIGTFSLLGLLLCFESPSSTAPRNSGLRDDTCPDSALARRSASACLCRSLSRRARPLSPSPHPLSLTRAPLVASLLHRLTALLLPPACSVLGVSPSTTRADARLPACWHPALFCSPLPALNRFTWRPPSLSLSSRACTPRLTVAQAHPPTRTAPPRAQQQAHLRSSSSSSTNTNRATNRPLTSLAPDHSIVAGQGRANLERLTALTELSCPRLAPTPTS